MPHTRNAHAPRKAFNETRRCPIDHARALCRISGFLCDPGDRRSVPPVSLLTNARALATRRHGDDIAPRTITQMDDDLTVRIRETVHSVEDLESSRRKKVRRTFARPGLLASVRRRQGPEGSGPETDGGAGVREPRRPKPSGGRGSIKLSPDTS
jgi:hypothetical protein